MTTSSSENPWLTPEQVIELTGKRVRSAQVRWLKRMGIKHHVNGIGRVIVPASSLIEHQGGTRPRVKTEPHFEALKEKS